MRTVQFSEAKARLSALIDAVEAGEVINISRHGRSVARIVGPEANDKERAMRAVERIREMKRNGRKTGITVEDILSARDEGRH